MVCASNMPCNGIKNSGNNAENQIGMGSAIHKLTNSAAIPIEISKGVPGLKNTQYK